MKYLEIPELSGLAARFRGLDLDDRILDVCIEAYSLKKTTHDKKLHRNIETKITDGLDKTPTSPLGPLSRSETRDLLINLINTMNVACPDYDFTSTKPDQFEPELNHYAVITLVNNVLISPAEKLQPDIKEKFWQTIDDVISISKCEIYKYVPEVETDLFPIDCYSFNYFFLNKPSKKILFLRCGHSREDDKVRDDIAMTPVEDTNWSAEELKNVEPNVSYMANSRSPIFSSHEGDPLASPFLRL